MVDLNIDTIESAVNLFESFSTSFSKIISKFPVIKKDPDFVELEKKMLTLQNSVLRLENQKLALDTKIANMEKELMNLKDWEIEKKNYKLTKIGGGLFVYSMKEVNDSIRHWLCASCFDNGIKSILNRSFANRRPRTPSIWKCITCNSEHYLPSNISP